MKRINPEELGIADYLDRWVRRAVAERTMMQSERIARAESDLAEALSLLREGARCHKYDQCPICDAGLGDPCVPGCRLAAFLAKHPEPSTVEGTGKLPANSEPKP